MQVLRALTRVQRGRDLDPEPLPDGAPLRNRSQLRRARVLRRAVERAPLLPRARPRLGGQVAQAVVEGLGGAQLLEDFDGVQVELRGEDIWQERPDRPMGAVYASDGQTPCSFSIDKIMMRDVKMHPKVSRLVL